jgi:hypothetical protein
MTILPERCSDLEVVRYDADRLHGEFGHEFRKVGSVTELHRTPRGAERQFIYADASRPRSWLRSLLGK